MSTISFSTTAPLHVNGEQVNVNIKRNALDIEFKTNFTTLQNKLNHNPLVAGTGLDSDNLGTACILPRNLSKQMGSKDFYFADTVNNATNFNSSYNSKWYVTGIGGGTILQFNSIASSFISNTTPLAIFIADNNSTIECDVNFGYRANNNNNTLAYINDIELSTSPTFTSITATKIVKVASGFNTSTGVLGNQKVLFTGLTAGTYYIRPVAKLDSTSYSVGTYFDRTTINYEVSNATFN